MQQSKAQVTQVSVRASVYHDGGQPPDGPGLVAQVQQHGGAFCGPEELCDQGDPESGLHLLPDVLPQPVAKRCTHTVAGVILSLIEVALVVKARLCEYQSIIPIRECSHTHVHIKLSIFK